MTPPDADLLIVIVNYRSADLVVDCLASLEPEVVARPGTHVAIVENESGADQWDRLQTRIGQRGWTGWVTLMAAGRNGGFAAGNNVALRWALNWPRPPRLFWLLNPDTIVRPGALAALIEPFEQRAEIGIVGSGLENLDGSPQHSAFRFPSVLGEFEDGMRFGPVSRWLRRWSVVRGESTRPEAVDWVSGASFVVRRAVFEQVGLLDEGYFMYYEEVDLCRRAGQAGWTCWVAPAARVVHLVGQSSPDATRQTTQRRCPRYWFEARNRYFLKHHGRLRTRLANLLRCSAFATYRLRRRIQGKPDNDPRSMLWDLLRYSVLTVKR